jgi:hypothetical protein
MAIPVDLADGIETIAESFTIGSEATDGKNYGSVFLRCRGAANFEDLRGHTGVDAIAAGMTSITGHDGEVGASDGKCGTTIVCVSVTDGSADVKE